MKITKNFTEQEFACRCKSKGLYDKDPLSYCGGLSVYDLRLVQKLQVLRDRVGVPVVITSGYRCPAYNRRPEPNGVGGATQSQHMLGRAADIQVQGYTPQQIAEIAKELGFSFIGIYDTFTHVDVRTGVSEPMVRDYRKGVVL